MLTRIIFFDCKNFIVNFIALRYSDKFLESLSKDKHFLMIFLGKDHVADDLWKADVLHLDLLKLFLGID
jgi:hypothetical protein